MTYADMRLHRASDHWEFQYPHLQWSGGISSTGAVGIYKLLINPSTELLNWHIKLTAMVLWLVSALYLIRKLINDRWVGALALLGTGALGLQFIEPTSELIGATFFNLFVLLICRQRFLLGGISLALFGLAKVEMLPASLLVLSYAAWRYRQPESMRLLFGYCFTIVLLVAPALYIHGSDGLLGGRALAVFQFHYDLYGMGSSLAGAHTPFSEAFNNPSSVMQAVLSNPREYTVFIGQSLIESLANLFISEHFYILGFLVIFWFGKHWRPELGAMSDNLNAAASVTFLLLIITVAVSTIFAFVHFRYTTRFAALVTILFAAMLERTCTQPEKYCRTPPTPGRCLSTLRITLGVLAFGGILRVPWMMAHPMKW
ncbi:hypothetical protein [uncultured Thiodictyon sp.]|uniref:hypothetical protein n=1 Tax=uncultured Thiodictyon sp. TaxID=1846217 RepID=UPI0025DB78F2|nr:hypothetical protein [uncultured Thiodictyon sp.]